MELIVTVIADGGSGGGWIVIKDIRNASTW